MHDSRMRILRTVVAMGWAALSSLAAAQVPTEQLAGLRDGTPRWHALTGVTLVAAPGREVPKATVVMRDGLIVAAGAGVPVPAGARVWPLDGRRVYAGFIDLVSSFGVPAALQAPPPVRPRFGLGAELPPPAGPRAEPRPLAARGLAAGSPMLRAEQDVAAQLEWRPETARSLRELGFTAVLATPATGVWRGQGALLALGVAEPGNARAQVMAPRVTQHLAFDATRRAELVYPSSQMGAVAMARQALHDARWYRAITTAGGERVEPNDTLAALGGVLDGSQPVVAVADDEQDYERIARLRDEFKLTRLFVEGNGYEYRRAAQIRALGLAVVAPLDFPAAPDVQDADSALDVPLDTLQHWEQAPSGPALLHRAGVPLALTTAGLRDAPGEFWARVRLAVQRGWPADAALAALTTQPAALLGQAARLGTVEPGRIAHLVVTRGDPFVDDEAVVEMVFVDGRPLRSDVSDRGDPRGEWAVDGDTAVFNVAGTRRAPRVEGAPSQARCPVVPNGREWQLRIPCNAPEAAAIVAALQGDDRLVGSRQQPDGTWQPWSATRRSAFVPPAKPAPQTVPAPPAAVYPAGMYGVPMPARPAVLLVRNATLWTQGPAGRIDGADLLVRDGRIAAVGRSLNAPDGAEVIDAAGRHVTPGLIDAHSHIAVRGGVNEFTASNTAEVRIIDALDATDINIYRQLAGGLTASNVLHGSANTIGGQSQVIKLRWGADAGGLVFEGAKPSIKFALGENPRSVNFRNAGRDRYPTTRMGVEQVLRDSFAAAREYAAAHRAWRDAPRGRPEPRRDLRLEALAEVLERRRAIHVHSYRADEILMFARFARDNGLEVAAFQHVLEGYKAAQAIASIGAGASTFSDWWGFKMEVQDAVPDNAAMLHRAGVLTTMNSDDPELGRRMNTEAAKAMRHGGLSEQEALSLVTLNAARQLGVGHRTGSLEVGKDADFVIWSGPPLSTSSRAEQTWVDGRRHFDVATDRQLRVQGEAERRRLVAAVAAFTAAQGARRPGASADAPADLPIPPSSLSELALMRALQAARGQRSSYAGFDAPHECTTDGTHLHGVAP